MKLDVEKCGYNYFKFASQAVQDKYQLPNSYCINSHELIINGDKFENEYTYLSLMVKKCENTT